MSSIDFAQTYLSPSPQKWLKRAGAAWFYVACAGQLAFIYFICTYYGTRTFHGDWAAWNDKPLIDGHIDGDMTGNLMFISHVLMAVIITFGGLMQLIPALRRRMPAAHRWNGRLFIAAAYFMALGGLWLGWVRGTHLSMIAGYAISLNAALILIFATLALRRAMQGRIEDHRRWAMRTFMVVNGVWFLRIGMMAWIVINQGPVGMNRTMSGPMDIVLTFGSYLIPLAVLEFYMAAQRSRKPRHQWAATAAVSVATLITAIGVFGTVAFMWGPYL
ncbi:MAG: DUF2306 domain-containing protein [Pseudomonadota bacterium]